MRCSLQPISPYLLHPYNRTRVISTDATIDPARLTRFEKKKNMLPNVPHKQQFHVDVVGSAPQKKNTHAADPCLVTDRIGQSSRGALCGGRKLGRRNLSW